MRFQRIFLGFVLVGLILSACSTAKAQPKIVMGTSTGESSCSTPSPGTVTACKLHVGALGTEQPTEIIPIQAVQDKGYSEISATDLNSSLENKDFTLVNVHVPFISNLPQTDLSIPYDQIDQNLNKLPTDKGAKIILYCSSGHMSGIAATDLVKKGYTNVWSLTGGMSAWQQAGLTLEK